MTPVESFLRSLCRLKLRSFELTYKLKPPDESGMMGTGSIYARYHNRRVKFRQHDRVVRTGVYVGVFATSHPFASGVRVDPWTSDTVTLPDVFRVSVGATVRTDFWQQPSSLKPESGCVFWDGDHWSYAAHPPADINDRIEAARVIDALART